MPIENHPFSSLGQGQARKPWLLVRYVNPHTGQSLQTYALIDTGAHDCALPEQFAKRLGHDFAKGPPHKSATAGGVVSGFKHTMRIDISGFTTEESLIAFMPKLHVPLLGVRSFLSHFILTVNYPEEWFSLKKP